MGGEDCNEKLPSSWIDSELIRVALKLPEETTIESIDVQSASKKATGYLSAMFRVTVFTKDAGTRQTNKKSLIVKAMPVASDMKELVMEMKGYSTETTILHEVMPQLHDRLVAVEGDDFRPLAARCYHWGREPVDFLVLEDLEAEGFQLAEAGRPPDHAHCGLVLKAYARLHAASAQLLRQLPSYRQRLDHYPFSSDGTKNQFRSMVDKLLTGLACELDKCPGYEQYADKYRTFYERRIEDCIKVMMEDNNNNPLSVLIHGDCWKNNLMFKYVDGMPTEIRLVDFQISRLNSPVTDVQFFLFANGCEELHRLHLDRLLDEYHGQLDGLLRRLGLQLEADAFSLERLQQEMDRRLVCAAFLAVFSAFTLGAEMFGEDFVVGVNSPQSTHVAVSKVFRNPYLLSYMKYLTLIFHKKGLL